METQAKFVLTPVAGAIAAALYPSIQAVAQDDVDDESFLDEIIVTSTKREMNIHCHGSAGPSIRVRSTSGATTSRTSGS